MDKRLLIFVTVGALVIAGGKVIQIAREDPGYFAHPSETQGFITAAGMTPQTDLIREIATEHGWEVVCEGQSGEMTTLGLGPTLWPWRSERLELMEAFVLVSSGTGTQRARPSGEDCGYSGGFAKVPEIDGAQEELAIAGAPPGRIEPYLQIAHDCGLSDARVGPFDAEYRAEAAAEGLGELPSDWVGVFVGSEVELTSGPLMCTGMMIARHDADNPG